MIVNYATYLCHLPARACGLLVDLPAGVDYITPNESELGRLTGMPTGTREQIEVAARSLQVCSVYV